MADYDSRDAASSTTTQLLFGLLAGNLLAILCVGAFRPFGNAAGLSTSANLVLKVEPTVAAGTYSSTITLSLFE